MKHSPADLKSQLAGISHAVKRAKSSKDANVILASMPRMLMKSPGSSVVAGKGYRSKRRQGESDQD